MLKKYVIIALCALNMAGTANSMSYFRRFTAPISASIALYSANYFGSKPAKSGESSEIDKLISRSDSSLWHLTQSRAGSLKSSEWIKSLSEPGATVRTQGHRKFSDSWNNEKTGRSTLSLSQKCSGSVPKNVLEWAVLNPEKIATERDQASVEVLE